MDGEEKDKMIEQFKEDVKKGFSQHPKKISSKYFYDARGDKLFQQIMAMPEYYLTRAEHEIFKTKTNEIIETLQLKKETHFDLIELGAGDGTKTKELLRELAENNFAFSYLPIDISQHALDGLEPSLKNELPQLNVAPQQGLYFEVLASLKENTNPKVILFLGSNIGNLPDDVATKFIYQLGSNLHQNDKVFLGVDLIKSADVVLPAYNDSKGITREFNLNLLRRMNRELDANFNLENFEHRPEYTEKEGIARSFIESTKEQTVKFGALNQSFYFEKGERIHSEISRKYNDEVLNKILTETDFEVIGKLTDSKNYFADYILNRK